MIFKGKKHSALNSYILKIKIYTILITIYSWITHFLLSLLLLLSLKGKKLKAVIAIDVKYNLAWILLCPYNILHNLI